MAFTVLGHESVIQKLANAFSNGSTKSMTMRKWKTKQLWAMGKWKQIFITFTPVNKSLPWLLGEHTVGHICTYLSCSMSCQNFLSATKWIESHIFSHDIGNPWRREFYACLQTKQTMYKSSSFYTQKSKIYRWKDHNQLEIRFQVYNNDSNEDGFRNRVHL